MENTSVKAFMFLIFAIVFFPSFSNEITFSSDQMSANGTVDNMTSILSGNACVTTDTIIIKSDNIQLSGKSFSNINANGNVNGEKDKLKFSSDVLKYNRDKRFAEFFGNVEFVDSENDATVKGDYASYDEKTEILIIKFNVSIVQKEKKCKSSFANYNRNTLIINLVGDAEIIDNENIFSASDILINLKTDDIKLQGKVSGKIIEKE